MSGERTGPSGWLSFTATVGASLLGSVVVMAISWGRAEARHDALERRVSTNESSIGTLQREQNEQGRALAGLEPELRAINKALDNIQAALSANARR